METLHLRLFMVLCLGINWCGTELLQRQKRRWIIDSFSIKEEYKGPFPYSLGHVKVEKKFTEFQIFGEGADEDPKGVLKIDRLTGELCVHKEVDFETKSKLELVFQAFDKEKNEIDTQLGIEILIEDDNDEKPTFTPSVYETNVAEATEQGHSIITIQAVDRDTEKENKMVDLQILSISPKPEDVTFYFKEVNPITGTGTISFKGCLDHEKTPSYTLIVEAKDRGIKRQLSSTCTVIILIQDGNNHIPKITGYTTESRVEEGVKGQKISDIIITDSDMGFEARKVQFFIHGDTNEYFNMDITDDSSEAYLYVKEALDFEKNPRISVNISVENTMAYSICKVKSRSDTTLWEVDRIQSDTISGLGESTSQSSFVMTVFVENVNEAPIFKNNPMQVMVQENIQAGTYLYTLEAWDPDTTSKDSWVYIKGKDISNWLKVDSETGKITTTDVIDREASFVKDGTYAVLVHAVDNGVPPMTATGTFTVIINDENDNVPKLSTKTLDMCQDDAPSKTNLTAFDADDSPYSGPFRFKLLGDVKGKWKVVPKIGETVQLVKEVTVHSGVHQLSLELMDLQGESIVENMTVRVCECLDQRIPNCNSKRDSGSRAGGGTIGIVCLSILLLAVLLLLAIFMSCKDQFTTIEMPCEDSGRLMSCNTENPGTDCKVGCEQNKFQQVGGKQRGKKKIKYKEIGNTTSMKGTDTIDVSKKIHGGHEQMWQTKESQWNSEYWRMRRIREQGSMRSNQTHLTGEGYDESFAYETEILHKVIETMQHNIQALGKEQYDYEPNVYVEEGEEGGGGFELDAITISDVGFDVNSHLDPKFTTLGEICLAEMPRNITAQHRTSSSVVETMHTSPYSTTSSSVFETLPSPAYQTTSISVSKTLPLTAFDTTSSGVLETRQTMKMQKTQQKFHHTGYEEYSGVTSQQEMGGSFFMQ